MTAYIATPVRKATAAAADMVLLLKSESGTMGSGARLSAAMKTENRAAADEKSAASCHEYQGQFVPPVRKPIMSSVIQAVRVDTPSQSTVGLALMSLDS